MSMRKIYLKKLISIIITSLAFFGIYCVAAFLLRSFINFIKNDLMKALLFLAVPMAFVFIRVYRRRLENAELRRAYLKDLDGVETSLKKRIMYVLKSMDFRAEISAFATVLLLILAYAFIVGGAKGYFWTNVLSFAISFVLYEGIYIIVDMIVWLIIHKKWYDEKI